MAWPDSGLLRAELAYIPRCITCIHGSTTMFVCTDELLLVPLEMVGLVEMDAACWRAETTEWWSRSGMSGARPMQACPRTVQRGPAGTVSPQRPAGSGVALGCRPGLVSDDGKSRARSRWLPCCHAVICDCSDAAGPVSGRGVFLGPAPKDTGSTVQDRRV